MAQQVFTEQEKQHAAHAYNLMMRQVAMGLPPALAVSVLAMAAGSVAHDAGVPREDLPNLIPIMQQAFDGQAAGASHAKAGGR
ncbi:hypothetical protein [Polyangium sp. 15x6]|uniref:hypothetical protein n=1 Tax=Polyangium sp. 15x6 TaxID=3042687 RepID=UPI00249A0615|nr:hypothetical protein [Polyangium sp. 15x6]MDI3285157.1 hypothetical protein [Polyangium sp. 15x6]